MSILSGLSSITALPEPVILSLLIVIVIIVLGYIFFPALSLSFSDPINVDEETLSPKENESNDVLLSIVIPAYNEEERLPIMLDAATAYVDKHRKSLVETCCRSANITKNSASCIEWLIVNDGSTDGTCKVARNYYQRASRRQDVWKLFSLTKNGGKGAAVKAGMMRARGHLCLMVDADGATDFEVGLQRVLAQLSPSSTPVVFGSRAHLQGASGASRSWVRTALMHAFHFFVKILCCSSSVKDTQCGFKLFTKSAAQDLFGNLHLRRWAFDTELVVLAHFFHLNIAEVAVPWQEVEGSKLDTSKLALALVSVSMLRDMICVRACYTLGLWKARHKQQ